MSMAVTLTAGTRLRFSIPDWSRDALGHARRHPEALPAGLAPVGARGDPDELGEARAEGAERRAADFEADLRHAQLAGAQQRHRALDPAGHQVAVGRLAVGRAELPAEVPGRHVRAARERLHIQRLSVVTVDPVAHTPQRREVAQALIVGGGVWHRASVADR